MKIFGREPAVIIGFVGAVITVVVALNVQWLSAGQGAAAAGFITALVIAATTRPVAPALFTAVVTAAAALFAEYGMHASDALIAGITGLVLAGFTLITRPQVTPNADPRPTAPL